MNALRDWLQNGALVALFTGPPFILVFVYLRNRRLPGFIWYATVSAVISSAAFLLLFVAAELILEQQFQKIVPNGEWTASDEARWTDAERQIVSAYFGDGGGKVFALLAPFLLLGYSIVLWSLARGVQAVFRRRFA